MKFFTTIVVIAMLTLISIGSCAINKQRLGMKNEPLLEVGECERSGRLCNIAEYVDPKTGDIIQFIDGPDGMIDGKCDFAMLVVKQLDGRYKFHDTYECDEVVEQLYKMCKRNNIDMKSVIKGNLQLKNYQGDLWW